MKKILAFLLVVALIFSFAACAKGNEPTDTTTEAPETTDAETVATPENAIIRLATTTSVNDSGLLPYLLPTFEAKTGYKVECLTRSDKACFTASDKGKRLAGEWWLTIRSVIAFGYIESVTDPATIADISKKLSLRFTHDETYIQEEIDKYLASTLLLAFRIEHLTGKVVREK